MSPTDSTRYKRPFRLWTRAVRGPRIAASQTPVIRRLLHSAALSGCGRAAHCRDVLEPGGGHALVTVVHLDHCVCAPITTTGSWCNTQPLV